MGHTSAVPETTAPPQHPASTRRRRSLLPQLHQFLAEYGYWALALTIGLESMGLPLPGETILVMASLHAGHRGESIAPVIAAAVAGAIIGDNIGYYLGRELGFRFLLRFGRYVGITDRRIKLGQYLFMKHGAKVVFFGRFVAILRCLAAFLAGVNQLSWPRFLVANAAGAVVWAMIFGLGAYFFGREFTHVVGPISLAAIALGASAVVWGFSYLSRHELALEEEAERVLPGPVGSLRMRRKRLLS
jgi:membrane protein DedA with SNARE-associated domain